MEICISKTQHKVHVITETVSLLTVPFLWSAANASPQPHRWRLKALVIGIIVVDGGLLLRWYHHYFKNKQ